MKIVFMGVGALGSTAAVLCRSLNAELVFVDFDRVESKNLTAQAFTKQTLGKNKAEALKAQFLNFWGIKTEAFSVRCTSSNVERLCRQAYLVVDCFDNQESRQVLSQYAQTFLPKGGLPLLHAALSGDGTFGLVRWDEQFKPDKEDQARQATCEGGEHLPFIGMLAGALALTIQDFVLHQKKKNLMVSLSGVTST